MTKEKLIICFEGNIGCGKSSIIELYKDDQRFFSIHAEKPLIVGDNDLFQFQIRKLISVDKRYSDILKNYHKNAHQDRILIERSALSDRHVFILFYSMRYLETFESHLLYDLDGIMNSGKLLPDIVVYVKTKPEKIHERLLKRNGGEKNKIKIKKNFTLEDLKDLDFLYEQFISKLRDFYNIPVFEIDGNKTLAEIQNEDLKELEPIFEKLLWNLNNNKNNNNVESSEKLDCTDNEKIRSSWDHYYYYYISSFKNIFKNIYNFILRKKNCSLK